MEEPLNVIIIIIYCKSGHLFHIDVFKKHFIKAIKS